MIRALIVFLALAVGARAWDPAGHMLVGEIAWQSCKPEVREKVNALVHDLDGRFSGGQVYNFVTAGCWMDDMRGLKRDYQWSKWHYVEILKSDDGSGFVLPEPPHVVWAIEEAVKTLKDPVADAPKRVEALGFLIHGVGDIHQPLHTCGWNDRGGNGYLVYGVAFADLFKGTKPNLHAFWDEAYRVEARDGKIAESFLMPELGHRPEPGAAGVIANEARTIMERFPASSVTAEITQLDPVAWARESYTIACLKGFPPGAHPADTEVRTIEPEFATASRTTAERQVALAGYRLAKMLELLVQP